MKYPLACLGTLIALSLTGPAQGARSFDNCSGYINALPAVITTQGTYCMNKDLSTTLSSGAAVTILTNNVILDCNDYKLGNLGAGVDTHMIGIYSLNRLNHTVRNCNVRGFQNGILLGTEPEATGGGHIVEDNRLEASRMLGIAVSGAGSIVRNNRVVDTGEGDPEAGDSAIGISVALGVDVVDNTVDGVTNFRRPTGAQVRGIYAYVNEGDIERNTVRNISGTNGGPGGANVHFIRANYSSGTIVDNRISGELAESEVAIYCTESLAIARDNIALNTTQGVVTCIDAGNNFHVGPL